MRELLPEFGKLIIELNKLSADIAELELRNNLDASRRVINGISVFEKKHLEPFKNKIRGIRTDLLLTKKNKNK